LPRLKILQADVGDEFSNGVKANWEEYQVRL